MKIKVSLENMKRVSKNGNEYNVAIITINKCGLKVIVEDFKVILPIKEEDLECNLVKVDNRYVIEELSYTIPWQYSIAIGLLFLKFGGSIND